MPRQLVRLLKNPGFSFRIWRYRLVFWGGAASIALAAILFAKTSVLGNQVFSQTIKAYPLLALVITPAA